VVSNPSEQPIDVLSEARKALACWQPRLRLTDWDIWVEIGPVAHPDWAAFSDKEWRMRRAHITLPPDYLQRIHDGAECLPGETDAQSVEHTVLHELLHILEEPLAARVATEIDWWVGDSSKQAGVVGAELRNSWRDYREWWINHVARVLLDGYSQLKVVRGSPQNGVLPTEMIAGLSPGPTEV
jgi:hypothetical protein